MVDPASSQTAAAFLADTRARAHQWGGQLGQLFGWLLMIEFGLMSVALGLIVLDWPQTPEFLASAAGAWLLLLAGCRGLAAFARSPAPSLAGGDRSTSGLPPSGPAVFGAARPMPSSPESRGPWVSSSSRASGVSSSSRAPGVSSESRAPWARSINALSGRDRAPWAGREPVAKPFPSAPGRTAAAAGPASSGWRAPISTPSAWPGAGSSARLGSASVPLGSASVPLGSASAASTGRSTAGLRVAMVEVAMCVGTGFVLLHADWPARPAAIPIALAFAGIVAIACAALDVLVARFGHDRYPRQRVIRAAAWMLSGLILMALIRESAPAALATAAVLIGLAETGLGGWLLNRAIQERHDAAERPATGDPHRPPEPDHALLVGFLTGADIETTLDLWPAPVPSEPT